MRLTRAEIDLTALKHNYDGVRRRVGPNVKIMGVVKANAYGHGIVEIARALERYGCDQLGVAFLEEGIVLREHGVQVPILVLGGVLGEQIKEFIRHRLDITVCSVSIAERVDREIASDHGNKAKVHLKIDTGMTRLGVKAEHALAFVRRVRELKNVDIVGIFSHFATSDEHDKSFAYEQLDRFNRLLGELEATGIKIALRHMANSGAILDMPDANFSMVRPGIMLYGCYPSKATSESVSLKPVLSLKSKVVYLKEVAAKTSISYGRTYFTDSSTMIATVPVGYGDGYSRRLTNRTDVLIRGRRYPVVGTICMDQLMVDVGKNSDIAIGDDVVLIGESITAWDIAERSGTIPYEVLTALHERVPRQYIQQ